MELLQAWLVFPVVIISTSVGLGIAVFRRSGIDLQDPLVLPAGLVTFISLGTLFALSSKLAPVNSNFILAITLICIYKFWKPICDWYRYNAKFCALGLGVFYFHGLPIILSGTPTFAGWIKLDDGATWLAATDQILRAGRNTSGLNPSTHEAITQLLFNPNDGGLPYPTGSFVSLGVFSKWLSIDPAWLLQPFMAAAAMTVCFAIIALVNPIEIPAWSKFLAAFMAPMSALYLGYEMWGGIKEILFVPILLFVAAMVPIVLDNPQNKWRIFLLVLGCLGCISVFGPFGAIWFFATISSLAAILINKSHFVRRRLFILLGIMTTLTLGLIVIILNNSKFFAKLLSWMPSSSDIGNLFRPLKFSQIFGVWLTGDFRYVPEFPILNAGLIILAASLFIVGCVKLLRFGHYQIAILAIWVTCLSVISLKGNAWISGKTLAISSPIVLAVVFCAIGFLASKHAVKSRFLALVLSAGILGSFTYTFHEVWLAPYDQLKELETIGKSKNFASPALMLEYSPYGARHFLRLLDTEGASELRRHLIPLKDGRALGKQAVADIDEFSLDSIQSYQTLVLRTSANSSRPPSNYDLTIKGRFYEVWQKNSDAIAPLKHFSFGSKESPTAIPECSYIDSIIQLPYFSTHRVLASSGQSFTKLQVINVTDLSRNSRSIVYESKFEILKGGQFDLWVEGWIKGRAKIFIDNELVAVSSHVLNQYGTMAKIGGSQIASGSHILKVVTDTPWMTPGSGGTSAPMGPFYLSDQNKKTSVEFVPNADIKTLCTKSVDWIELIPK